MPSPFPGMDPYLEHPGLWSGVHSWLIGELARTLNTILPPHYAADIGERLYVVDPGRSIYPDVAVFRTPPRPPAQAAAGASTAVLESDPPITLRLDPVEMRETFVEILPVADQSRIVTVLEVLSPYNKELGSPGRRLYLAKQREVLHGETHLVEIDLLRRGEHTVAAPRVPLLRKGRWDYLVCLHRGGSVAERDYDVWLLTLRQRLPRISVPLSVGDPDLVLDLQAVFGRCYDDGGYARRIDYQSDPYVSLTDQDLQWAQTLLFEKGLRQQRETAPVPPPAVDPPTC